MFLIGMLQALALAGPAEELSEMEHTLLLCSRMAESANTQAARVTSWQECADEATSNQISAETLSRLEGQIAWEQYKLEHSGDSLSLADQGLRAWANDDLWLPSDELVSMWIALNANAEIRSNLSDVRVVTLRWMPYRGQDPDFVSNTYDQLVRSVADAGFRVPDPEHTDSSNANIYLNVAMRESQGDPTDEVPTGAIHRYRVGLRASSVNFETKGIRTGPIEGVATSSDSRVEIARVNAMEKATADFAIRLVERVVRVVFREQPER